MQEFDDLTTAVNNLIAADEAENTLLTAVLAQLNQLLSNPTGVSPTEVTALRDKVAAELAKVNTAIGSAGPFTVGGNLSGLDAGNSVTLLNIGGDSLQVTANGPFTFATALTDGAAYAVTVGTDATGQTTTIAGGSGVVAGSNITSVVATSADNAATPAAAAAARAAKK